MLRISVVCDLVVVPGLQLGVVGDGVQEDHAVGQQQRLVGLQPLQLAGQLQPLEYLEYLQSGGARYI